MITPPHPPQSKKSWVLNAIVRLLLIIWGHNSSRSFRGIRVHHRWSVRPCSYRIRGPSIQRWRRAGWPRARRWTWRCVWSRRRYWDRFSICRRGPCWRACWVLRGCVDEVVQLGLDAGCDLLAGVARDLVVLCPRCLWEAEYGEEEDISECFHVIFKYQA